jgi:hypothetical protein
LAVARGCAPRAGALAAREPGEASRVALAGSALLGRVPAARAPSRSSHTAGSLALTQERIDSDPRFFLERARSLGPIFKVILNGNYTTCVLGHERGARLIGEHEDHLPGVTIDLAPLFPIGALRGMGGDTHRRYRRLFLHAIQATPLSAHRDALDARFASRYERWRASTGRSQARAARAAARLTTEIMLRLIYGFTPESPVYATLEASYRRFGPEAPAAKLGDEQLDAFAEIRRVFTERARDLANGASASAPPCFLGHLVRSGEVDATALGNLAYLFEPSHFDLYSLWHWMLKLLGGRADLHAAYRARTGEERRHYARRSSSRRCVWNRASCSIAASPPTSCSRVSCYRATRCSGF